MHDNKKELNRFLDREAEKLKPPRLKEIERAFRDGTARKWSKEELYGVRSYLDRLQISFEKDMETGFLRAESFKMLPFKGIGRIFPAAKGFFAETMQKAAEMRSGKSAIKSPITAGKTPSAASASTAPKSPATMAAKTTGKTPFTPQREQRDAPPPPKLKVIIIMKLIDLCVWLCKQALKFLDEIAQVNREVTQVQAGQARVRSKF